MSWPYSEAMAMRPDVTYIPCATSWVGKTDNIITFTHFEDSDLLSEIRECAESDDKSGDKSNDESIMPPLLSVE